jgi:hypothetical protein
VLLSLDCNVLSTNYLEILVFGAFFMKIFNIHSMHMPQERGNFSFPATCSQQAVRANGNGESIRKNRKRKMN